MTEPMVRRLTRTKVKTLEEAAQQAELARQNGRTVVLAHGCFDLLHLGHVRHLEEAAGHGDMLVVTLTADPFVNKGPGRPVFSELLRAQMIAGLEHVDLVAINHAPTAVNVRGGWGGMMTAFTNWPLASYCSIFFAPAATVILPLSTAVTVPEHESISVPPVLATPANGA